MENRIRVFPWFLIVNIMAGCFGFNIGVFLTRIAISAFGAIIGIVIGCLIGWFVSTITIKAITMLLSLSRIETHIPIQATHLLSASISWSVTWASLPILINFTFDIYTLISILTIFLVISLLQLILFQKLVKRAGRMVLWSNLTGALIFMFAVFIMAWLKLSGDSLFVYAVWGIAIGLGSTLMLKQIYIHTIYN